MRHLGTLLRQTGPIDGPGFLTIHKGRFTVGRELEGDVLVLTAGMLPTMEIPQSPAQGKGRPLTDAEADAIQRAVDHAFGLYRLVLNGLGVDPLAGLPEQIHTGTSGDGGVQDGVKLLGEH